MLTKTIPPLDFEQLAQTLSVHPDFRVLRRLPDLPRLSGELPADAQIGLVLDCETTGKNATDVIIELGLVTFAFDPLTGEVHGVVDSYCGLEDPGMPIPPEASAVNGITDDMVKGQRIDDEKVLAMLKSAVFVVAHNSDFDRPKTETRFPAFSEVPWACSMTQVPWQAAGFLTRKLEVLVLEMGYFYEAHRADADCFATLQLLNNAPEGLQGQRGMGILLDELAKKTYRLWAEGSPFATKDMLRDRGYHWSTGDAPGSFKAWFIDCASKEEVDAELAWLEKAVFRRSFSAPLTELDSHTRFSARPGHLQTVYSS